MCERGSTDTQHGRGRTRGKGWEQEDAEKKNRERGTRNMKQRDTGPAAAAAAAALPTRSVLSDFRSVDEHPLLSHSHPLSSSSRVNIIPRHPLKCAHLSSSSFTTTANTTTAAATSHPQQEDKHGRDDESLGKDWRDKNGDPISNGDQRVA